MGPSVLPPSLPSDKVGSQGLLPWAPLLCLFAHPPPRGGTGGGPGSAHPLSHSLLLYRVHGSSGPMALARVWPQADGRCTPSKGMGSARDPHHRTPPTSGSHHGGQKTSPAPGGPTSGGLPRCCDRTMRLIRVSGWPLSWKHGGHQAEQGQLPKASSSAPTQAEECLPLSQGEDTTHIRSQPYRWGRRGLQEPKCAHRPTCKAVTSGPSLPPRRQRGGKGAPAPPCLPETAASLLRLLSHLHTRMGPSAGACGRGVSISK